MPLHVCGNVAPHFLVRRVLTGHFQLFHTCLDQHGHREVFVEGAVPNAWYLSMFMCAYTLSKFDSSSSIR